MRDHWRGGFVFGIGRRGVEEGGSTGESQNGIRPGRRFQTIDESEQQVAATDAQGSPARNFPGQERQDVRPGHGKRGQQQIDQEHGEQPPRWIVDTGLDLEGPGDTRPQLETAQM